MLIILCLNFFDSVLGAPENKDKDYIIWVTYLLNLMDPIWNLYLIRTENIMIFFLYKLNFVCENANFSKTTLNIGLLIIDTRDISIDKRGDRYDTHVSFLISRTCFTVWCMNDMTKSFFVTKYKSLNLLFIQQITAKKNAVIETSTLTKVWRLLYVK